MKILSFFRILYLLVTICTVIAAQSQSVIQDKQIVEQKPWDCEFNVAVLSEAHQVAGENGLIIVIARLGDNETKRELNHRRLHNVRVYLSEFPFGWHRKPETIITAEGERVKGYGRIELYVGGRLFRSLAVKRNGDFLVGSCEPDDIRPKKAEENLYPYRSKKPRKP